MYVSSWDQNTCNKNIISVNRLPSTQTTLTNNLSANTIYVFSADKVEIQSSAGIDFPTCSAIVSRVD